MKVTLETAEKIVDAHDNLFWDGWNIVVVNPSIDGYTKMSGIFFKGSWAVRKVVEADDRGLFELPPRYKIAA